MTEPQKVSTCKYCSQEITWHKDAVTGKNYPKNLNGSPHLCKKNAAPAQEKTPDQIAKEREEYNRKAQAAGFTTGNNCTSPDTPAVNPSNSTGLKTVEGQITTLDIPAHKVWLKDRKGDTHYFIWGPALHDQMSKLKPYWFVKLTGEYEKDVDLWRMTSQEYFKRPEDWPATVHRRVFERPEKNDKIIVLQTCLKVSADVRISRGFCQDEDGKFADQMAEIVAEAVKAADALCKAGGVQ